MAIPQSPSEEKLDALFGPPLEIPEASHLVDALTEVSSLGRNPAIARIKQIKKDEWARIYTAYQERINELTGFDVAFSLTRSVDTILLNLIDRALKSADAPDDWHHIMGFFAIGGYGRAEFNPASDLDVILLVKDNATPDWVSKVNAEFQALLWDCGFQVGASLRSLPELEDIIADDYVTATALIENRPLRAADELYYQLAECLQRFRDRYTAPYLTFKVGELLSRRRNDGLSSVFHLEPNLKTGAGCLRDIQFLRIVAFMLFGARTLHALREFETIESEDVLKVFDANAHLLSLRTLQHFNHSHRQDQLLLADQLRCAQQLGYGAQQSLREVEIFMRDLYEKMTMVEELVKLSIGCLHILGHLEGWTPVDEREQPLCDGFRIINGYVYLASEEVLEGADFCMTILKMARLAQQSNLRLSINLQRRLKLFIETQGIISKSDPQATKLFMDLMGDEGRVAPILRDLHGSGFLGAYLPEFGRITCHMQFNAYHHYTVDEHTLIAIEYLDMIARCDEGVPRILQQVNSTIVRHDLLSLGLLMHDVGKYMGRGHVPRGELMMGEVSKRLGLNDADDDVLRFLVREHVTLSDASRQVDISDPQQLDQLARRMGSAGRLDMLYCLTWPDAKAVGPKILTGWQEAILEDCYLAVRQQLEGRLQPLETRRQQIVTILHEERQLELAQATEYLDMLATEYPYQVPDPELAMWHYDLVTDVRKHHKPAVVDVRSFGDMWMIGFSTQDRKSLLADVAAICAGNGLDIQGCRVWSTTDGISLQSILVTGVLPARWKEAEAWTTLFKHLTALGESATDEQRWLDRRRQMILPETPMDSQIDDVEVRLDQSSDECAVLDVRGKDSPGLLAVLCRIIGDAGCQIDLAQVSTMGDQAVDVFYMTVDGQKPAPALMAQIEGKVKQAMRENH